MERLKIFRADDEQPDAESASSGANATVGPDLSVTELLMELEQSIVDADAEIQQEKAKRVKRVA